MKKRKGNLLKKMMAVLLTAVLVAGMTGGGIPAYAAVQTSGDYEYTENGDNTVTITKYIKPIGTSTDTNFTIPDIIDGKLLLQ